MAGDESRGRCPRCGPGRDALTELRRYRALNEGYRNARRPLCPSTWPIWPGGQERRGRGERSGGSNPAWRKSRYGARRAEEAGSAPPGVTGTKPQSNLWRPWDSASFASNGACQPCRAKTLKRSDHGDAHLHHVRATLRGQRLPLRGSHEPLALGLDAGMAQCEGAHPRQERLPLHRRREAGLALRGDEPGRDSPQRRQRL